MVNNCCVKCKKLVRTRQEGLQCDVCSRWQHRTCDSGISRADYQRMVHLNVNVDWKCYKCPDVSEAPDMTTLPSINLSTTIPQPIAESTGVSAFLTFDGEETTARWRTVYTQRKVLSKANSEELRRLTTYIRTYWFESTVFPVTSLSVFGLAIRTNNDCEGWHRRMNKRSNGQGLGFYVLVPFLWKEAEFVNQQIVMVQDELYTRDNRQKYCRIQKRLNTIWDDYSAGNISTGDMLKKTAVLYGDL